MSEFNTYLFGDCRIAVAGAGRGPYGHTFGGPPDRKGTSREDCKGILIHLLHRLDLTDPAIPLTLPGMRWLPLYYCFDFRANDLGYRLISDDQLITYFPTDDRNVSQEESWPDDNYPLEFPKSDIQVAPYPYDPTDLEDAYQWAGIFGIEKLSRTDRATARRRISEMMEGLGFYPPETDEEFDESLSSPFSQGKPDSPCLNPGCANHSRKGQLTTVAVMPSEPVEGVHLFGPSRGIQLIFRMCPLCHTFRVSNQSD